MENCYRGSLLENDRDRTNDVFTIDLATLTRLIEYDDVFELHTVECWSSVCYLTLWFFYPRYFAGTSSKSPGKTSPVSGIIEGVPGMATAGVGRTMKEYEDQLGALKKENFNLKLRIYFLEERMGITSADEGAIKKNIELKVRSLSECAK